MIKSFNGLIFVLVGGLFIAVITSSFGPKRIGIIIFILIVIASLLHVFVYIRTRIKIKIIKQNFFNEPYFLKYEAINLGEKPNSLQEKVYFKSLLPNIEKGRSKNSEPFGLPRVWWCMLIDVFYQCFVNDTAPGLAHMFRNSISFSNSAFV